MAGLFEHFLALPCIRFCGFGAMRRTPWTSESAKNLREISILGDKIVERNSV